MLIIVLLIYVSVCGVVDYMSSLWLKFLLLWLVSVNDVSIIVWFCAVWCSGRLCSEGLIAKFIGRKCVFSSRLEMIVVGVPVFAVSALSVVNCVAFVNMMIDMMMGVGLFVFEWWVMVMLVVEKVVGGVKFECLEIDGDYVFFIFGKVYGVVWMDENGDVDFED